MSADKTSWHCLPAEIRLKILRDLLQDGCSLARFATVSREWQTIIEKHNFVRIKLTPSRLEGFSAATRRNRVLVRYIWLCLELKEYDCTKCASMDMIDWGVDDPDNTLILIAFGQLFSALSAWEPNDSLMLDISVHSPSDSAHYFKYLTFEPDTSSDEADLKGSVEQSRLLRFDKSDDHQHGWIAGRQDCSPPKEAVWRISDQIMCDGPFRTEGQEANWWRQLPLVPAVSGVLLRQQTRRRWKPTALALMFARLPRLKEIHYEPWRELGVAEQTWSDKSHRALFGSLAFSTLQRLVLFENFNDEYSRAAERPEFWALVRPPTRIVSQTVAIASRRLEHLSASFMVDASDFLDSCGPSWTWSRLTSLALTARLLAPEESSTEIDNMLRTAATVAMRMANLETLEIWNGREGQAMLFRYQSTTTGPSVITLRGTWELTLQPQVIRAWEGLAGLEHHGRGCTIVRELLDAGLVKSHGDAIHHLKLSSQVIRPVSLAQIRMEQRMSIRG